MWAVLRADEDERGLERAVTLGLAALVLLNTIAVVLETVQSLRSRFELAFAAFEGLSLAVFSVEYLLRLWSCTTEPAYRRPFAGRLRWAVTPMALVDLTVVLPMWIPGWDSDLRMLRILRLLRFLRALKMARYSRSLQTLGRVLAAKRAELAVTAFAGGVLLTLASTGIFLLEHEAQPEQFPHIPAALWWGVVTLTTVGYGDVYPVTPLGKLLASCIAVLGIGLFALPAGILAGGFNEELQRKQAVAGTCPHCGEPLGGSAAVLASASREHSGKERA
jgi:voltage-gated potassium channel